MMHVAPAQSDHDKQESHPIEVRLSEATRMCSKLMMSKNQVLSPASPFPEQPSLQSLVQAQQSFCLRGCQVRIFAESCYWGSRAGTDKLDSS